MIGEKTWIRRRFTWAKRRCAFSWTASISYETPLGITPYVTLSEQVTVVASQMADLDPESVADGNAVASSELEEFGLKGSFLNDRLFVQAISVYEQERTNVSSQDVVTNQVVAWRRGRVRDEIFGLRCIDDHFRPLRLWKLQI